MMNLIRSMAIAFSLFSKIPMPQFAWEEESRRYVLCFFPWVGAVIGACVFGWSFLCRHLMIGRTAGLLITVAIPIFLTGGIHVDGFMDTMDALHSYQERERKLEILKDAHIGAFSVIMLLSYYLVYLAALSEIFAGFFEKRDAGALAVLAVGFFLSRTLSGIGVILLRPARQDGMLRSLSDSAGKKPALYFLFLQFFLCTAGMLCLSLRTGLMTVVAAVGVFFYYRHRSYRAFGGVTGDTAGYFLLLCEAAMAVAAAVSSWFL